MLRYGTATYRRVCATLLLWSERRLTASETSGAGLFLGTYNHRMAWVEKDHSAHPVPTPCCVQGHQPADQAAQRHIWPGLECLQGWGIHSLLGQPVPVRHHPMSLVWGAFGEASSYLWHISNIWGFIFTSDSASPLNIWFCALGKGPGPSDVVLWSILSLYTLRGSGLE